MTNEQQRKMESMAYGALVLFALLLMINTNNNPNALIQRVFKPIHFGNSTLYYAALFPLLIIYYSLKGIYRRNNYSFLDTGFRRILIIIVLCSIFSSFSQSGIKLYKSFSSDLNSIYCYRSSMSLSIETVEDKRRIVCKLELENCSSKDREFYVKVNVPSYLKEIKEKILINEETVLALHARERRKLEVIFDESLVNSGSLAFSGVNSFEFSLNNDSQEVKFLQRD